MKRYIVKTVQALVAIAMLVGVGFVSGLSTAPQAKAPVEVTQVAYESTPGPYGSGVLGDWSTLSHGLYCFNPNGTLQNSYTKAARKTQALSSASLTCSGEDVRLYGDSITFGGKSAFAAEMGARGLTTYVDAWSGRPTTPVADAICAETIFPPVVVVASGTNDIFNPTVMAAQIKRIQACIPATTKLFWVDVQATRWGQTDVIERNDQRNSMAVNLAIYQNMPTNRVLQWSQRFMSNPSLLVNYLVDGVHPKTGTGYAYWAAILRGWLDSLGGI
jgi:hypothetical protein